MIEFVIAKLTAAVRLNSHRSLTADPKFAPSLLIKKESRSNLPLGDGSNAEEEKGEEERKTKKRAVGAMEAQDRPSVTEICETHCARQRCV